MIYENIKGVPNFECIEFNEKKTKYCMLIPIINEGNKIKAELEKAHKFKIDKICDIIICDGGSTDDSISNSFLGSIGVNTLLIKRDFGKQGAQLRMGFWWGLTRGYDGFITVDGNNKDSIEDTNKFIEKLDEGFDFIQGSRFIKDGHAINTPLIRHLSVKLIHAPIISLTAKYKFTDTTNAFRGYSKKYIMHPNLQPFRDCFVTYELLAYLSSRASQLNLRVCEIPVTRAYPENQKIPTKISFFKGNFNLLKILILNLFKRYNV